jgi:nicotinamidase-related amidase
MYERPVLLVVDVQNGFVNGNSRHIVPGIVRLVQSWPSDVVFTQFFNRPGSQFERLIDWRLLHGPPETDLVPGLQPYAKTVVPKTGYSFFDDAGRRLAAKRGWKEVLVCGIDTESCVLKTAVDAFELNYTPLILEDLCASHAGKESHEAGIYVASRFIGKKQIVRTADLPVSPLYVSDVNSHRDS